MIFNGHTAKHKLQWKYIIITVTLVLGSAALLIDLLPEYYEITLFGLYSIPSHMLISPFPHEPYLLFISKYFSPLTISLVATLGCCIAGFMDYLLLMPLVNHRSLRPKFEKSNFYQKASSFFKKSPFLFLVGAALSPVPFYPIKFISIAANYPLWRYQLALIVGRTPRFFLLALLGQALQVPTWVLVTLLIVLITLPFVQKLKRKKESPEIEDVLPVPAPADDEIFMPSYKNILEVDEESEGYRRRVANS